MSRNTGYTRDDVEETMYAREARRKFLSYISIYVHYSTLKWIKNTLFHIIRGLQKGAIFWKGGQLAPLPPPGYATGCDGPPWCDQVPTDQHLLTLASEITDVINNPYLWEGLPNSEVEAFIGV